MLAEADVSAVLKVLADPTRLRILALLGREELRVGELSSAMDMSQSRVSNHLRLLREAGLLEERHAGSSTYLRLAAGPDDGAEFVARLWRTLAPAVQAMPQHASDLKRLDAVIEERERKSADFFDRVAQDWDKLGLDFETGQARQRAAALLLPPDLVLADLGCGTGYMARSLAGLARRVVCVDRSRAMLAQARERLARLSTACDFDFRQGELDTLPIEDGELDGLVAAMVLHHMPRLEGTLAEMRRVLKPGGSAVVLDLAPHRETWMHESQGDRHLGLDAEGVRHAFERAGFGEVALEPVDDHYRPAAPDSVAPNHIARNGAANGGVDASPHTGTARARLSLFLVRGRKPRLS